LRGQAGGSDALRRGQNARDLLGGLLGVVLAVVGRHDGLARGVGELAHLGVARRPLDGDQRHVVDQLAAALRGAPLGHARPALRAVPVLARHGDLLGATGVKEQPTAARVHAPRQTSAVSPADISRTPFSRPSGTLPLPIRKASGALPAAWPSSKTAPPALSLPVYVTIARSCAARVSASARQHEARPEGWTRMRPAASLRAPPSAGTARAGNRRFGAVKRPARPYKSPTQNGFS
jgi:hypothetical protein